MAARHTITYYPKSLDKQDLLNALREVGFSVKAGQSENASPTDTIWYGSEVRFKDVKKLALALKRAGIELKAIKPFSEIRSTANKKIHIGSDQSCAARKDITVEDIVAANDFIPSLNPCN